MKAAEMFENIFNAPKKEEYFYNSKIISHIYGNLMLGVTLATEAYFLKTGHDFGFRDVAFVAFGYTVDRIKNKSTDIFTSFVEKGFKKIDSLLEK